MTAQPTPTKSTSRRALLAGALGGIGAWAASTIGRATPVRAEGETMVVGGEYTTATSRTYLQNSANSSSVFEASSTTGIAIRGVSNQDYGVYGASGSLMGVMGKSYGAAGTAGVYGEHGAGYGVSGASLSGTGVGGQSGYGPGGGSKPKTGVYGYANQDKDSKGVWGFSGKGVGLFGQANKAGYALRTSGRIKADKVSGVATIPAGSTTVTVSPNSVNVTSSSFVLLTPKANLGSRGLWFTTNPNADSITIHISSTRSSNTKIAWLLLG